MPRHRGYRRSSRGSRAKTTWSQSSFSHPLAAAAGQFITDITAQIIVTGGEEIGTCRRLIGNLTLSPDAGAGLTAYNYASGVAVVTKDALSAGAIPDPIADDEQDWYYWSGWEGRMGITGTTEYT